MGYPFYHIKRCRKAAPTVRHTKIIKNHEIGPHNWKKVKNYENKPNDQVLSQINKAHRQYLFENHLEICFFWT